jgi:Coenzyme PQQ synthesis protein D (PqqD)
MNREIWEHSIVTVSKDQVSSDLGEGEVAILNLRDGTYYGLDAVGVRIWNLIQEPKTIGEIRNVLVSEYDVEPARCERELLALLQRLADEGLVKVEGETTA